MFTWAGLLPRVHRDPAARGPRDGEGKIKAWASDTSHKLADRGLANAYSCREIILACARLRKVCVEVAHSSALSLSGIFPSRLNIPTGRLLVIVAPWTLAS